MKKSIIHITLSVLVAFLVLSPSVFIQLDINTDSVVLIDLNEEDNQKKGEKKIEEKNLVFYSLPYANDSFQIRETDLFNFYQEGFSSFSSKILLPPPELKS